MTDISDFSHEALKDDCQSDQDAGSGDKRTCSNPNNVRDRERQNGANHYEEHIREPYTGDGNPYRARRQALSPSDQNAYSIERRLDESAAVAKCPSGQSITATRTRAVKNPCRVVLVEQVREPDRKATVTATAYESDNFRGDKDTAQQEHRHPWWP